MKYLCIPFRKPCACPGGIILLSRQQAEVREGVQQIAVAVYCAECGKRYEMGETTEEEE